MDEEASGLVAVTFHNPAAAFVRLNWQRSVSPMSCADEATISFWPVFVSRTDVSARNDAPLRSMVTMEFPRPLVGVIEASAKGGGGGGSLELPEISSE